jgi:hypothetical protein
MYQFDFEKSSKLLEAVLSEELDHTAERFI